MLRRVVDRVLRPSAPLWRQDADLRRIGIERLRGMAKRYNRWRYHDRERLHRESFEREFPKLLGENGSVAAWPPRIHLRDGWARDDSMTLPHIERTLDEAARIIADRGGRLHGHVQQSFFRDLLFKFHEDLTEFPSLLDFILSSEVLAIAAHHLGTVPVLSKALPMGVRFMESNVKFDPNPDGPLRESQLYHTDIHDSPLVYVLLLASDVDENSGPWTFLSASASARVKAALGYQKPGVPYRLTDEQVYSAIDPSEIIRFTGRKGSVLFIDSGACFHYGSRNAINPRFQLMYALTTPCRCDIIQTGWETRYPVPHDASHLRRMVTAPWKQTAPENGSSITPSGGRRS